MNDQATEKTRLFDMKHELEARNIELEKTVKSLYHKINNDDNFTRRNDEVRESLDWTQIHPKIKMKNWMMQ